MIGRYFDESESVVYNILCESLDTCLLVKSHYKKDVPNLYIFGANFLPVRLDVFLHSLMVCEKKV